MVQIRIMHTDADRVRQVAEMLLPLMRASGVFTVGDEVELATRGPGLRIVVDVTPAQPGPGRGWASAERVEPKRPAIEQGRSRRRSP